MINQLSVPNFVKLTKMSITSVCDVADDLHILLGKHEELINYSNMHIRPTGKLTETSRDTRNTFWPSLRTKFYKIKIQ